MTKASTSKINLREIARLAGTSKSTVSRVLRDQPRVSDETRRRVQEVIAKHDYRPNFFARGLSGARTGLIGVLSQWMESGFFAEVIRGIDIESRKHGGHLMSTFADDPAGYVSLCRNLIVGGQVDGLILIAPPMDIFREPLSVEGKPMVACAAAIPADAEGWGSSGYVVLDNRKAMSELVAHLVDKGCRRLVHLEGPRDSYDAIERSRTFREEVGRYPGMMGEVVAGAWTQEMGYARACEYVESHQNLPDAFVAYNDVVALGLLEALGERGIKVPDAVAVTGWDDIPLLAYARLTTVRIPMVELGRRSAAMLFAKLDGREDADEAGEAIEMQLTIRASTSDWKLKT